jgi:hypothetical protein
MAPGHERAAGDRPSRRSRRAVFSSLRHATRDRTGDVDGAEWLEFDSMINLRPSLGNRSRGVDDPATQGAIRTLVDALVRQ